MRKSKDSYKGEPAFAENLILGFSLEDRSHFFECPYCHSRYYLHNKACRCRDKCFANLIEVPVSKLVRMPSLSPYDVPCKFCGKSHAPLTKEALNCRDFFVYSKYFNFYSHLITKLHIKLKKRKYKKEANKK